VRTASWKGIRPREGQARGHLAPRKRNVYRYSGERANANPSAPYTHLFGHAAAQLVAHHMRVQDHENGPTHRGNRVEQVRRIRYFHLIDRFCTIISPYLWRAGHHDPSHSDMGDPNLQFDGPILKLTPI